MFPVCILVECAQSEATDKIGMGKATDWCSQAERASAATSLKFTFALVAKDLLLLPIEKITQITNKHQLARRWQCAECGSDMGYAVAKPSHLG